MMHIILKKLINYDEKFNFFKDYFQRIKKN